MLLLCISVVRFKVLSGFGFVRHLVFSLSHHVFLAGFFLEPAVFTDVKDGMFIATEESFGPVMIISKFKDG